MKNLYKSINGMICVISISLLSQSALATEEICLKANEKAKTILNWLVIQQQVNKIVLLPKIIAYKNVTNEEKKQYCKWCPLNANPQLNMFIGAKNEIWLADNVKEDQLAHELTHSLQYSNITPEDEQSDSSDELETQAVYWQNKYKEAYPVKKLCE